MRTIRVGNRIVKLNFAEIHSLGSCAGHPSKQLRASVILGAGYPLPLHMEKWIAKVCEPEASSAVVATDDTKIVGFVRWNENAFRTFLCGTFVVAGYRSKGLAKAMWKIALENFDPKKTIDVVAASQGGLDLLRGLEVAHPEFTWDIDTA